MYCLSCGTDVSDGAKFCPQCGAPSQAPAARSAQPAFATPQRAPSSSKFPWKLIVILVTVFFVLILGLVGGIVALVFYQIKESDAAKLAMSSLKSNPAAREALGEVESFGWPLGSFKTEGGGSGKATLSMSVTGGKATGKYYATLVRTNGVWNLASGRLEMPDGRSIPISSNALIRPPAAGPGAEPEPAVASSGGRSLAANAATTDWRTIEWPEEGISFKVPADWMQETLARREVSFRSPDRSLYFIGNATYFDQKIPFQSITPSLVQGAAGKLKRGEIEGYAVKSLGPVSGFLELSKRSDGQTTAAWTGYYDTAEFGTKSVTLLAGSGTADGFTQGEGVLGAILESVEIK